MANKKENPKKTKLPFMECNGFVEPYESYTNKAGITFYVYTCEGCGKETTIPEEYIGNIPPGSPMFFKKCGCTAKKELTQHHDDCKKCGGPIYLTPGTAMYKKYCEFNGEEYTPRKEYCDTCLDEIVHSGECRNSACQTVGGDNVVEATFRDQLFYEKKEFSFPPTNCKNCREVKREFKKLDTISRKCDLCGDRFTVTYKKLIMILKNEDSFQIPDRCNSCNRLSDDQLKLMLQERELRIMKDEIKERMLELFKKDKHLIAKEKQRIEEEKIRAREEKKDIFNKKNKLYPWFTQMVFTYLLQKGLIDCEISHFDQLLLEEFEQYKEKVRGKTQGFANKVFEGVSNNLGDKFIEIIGRKNPSLASILQKARQTDKGLQDMIESFDNSSKHLERLFKIASFCLSLDMEDKEDLNTFIRQGLQSKQDVDKIIGKTKIEEFEKTILKSKRLRFEKYGGIHGSIYDESISMGKVLNELKEKELDVFAKIVSVLSDPLRQEGIEMIDKYSNTKKVDSLMKKIVEKRHKKKDDDLLVYDFYDLIRGTIIFKNMDEWKKATHLSIELLNKANMLVSYDPLLLRDGKEYLIQINFDLKVGEEAFELQFKTQSSKLFTNIDHGTVYKDDKNDNDDNKLTEQEGKMLEVFKQQFLLTEYLVLSDDDSDSDSQVNIIEC